MHTLIMLHWTLINDNQRHFDAIHSLFNVLRNLNGTAVATSVQRRTYAVLEEGILLRRQIVLNSTRVFDSIQQCFEAIKRLLSWFWRLPKTIKLTILKWLTTLQHAFAVGVHASKLALKAIFYAFALLILVLSAFALLRLLRRCYKNHRQNKLTKLADEQWRRRREEIEQQRRTQQAAERRRWQESNDNQRKRREEQEQRQREQAQRVYEDLRREREQKQRQAEQEKRRQTVLDRMAYEKWDSRCSELLMQPNRMTSFPYPPVWPCTDGCRENELLKACRHSVKRLYVASGKEINALLFKKEKLRWHPDKFAACPSLVRERFQATGAELFKIIQALEEECNKTSKG